MKFLKKVVIAVILVIILAVLKIVFARIFPSSLLFHYNLMSSLQLFLLCWAVITGLLEFFLRKRNNPKKNARISFVLFISLIGGLEFFYFLLLNHPRFIPGKMLPSFVYYYNNYQRDILQYNKNISMYDSSLFYKMKPDNKSVFTNIEFSDSVFTNSKGFRDDESPLQNKKIICLGDSYTLGWGVQQQEAYPQLLEDTLKVAVLNTGMSSYGTAREVESVRHLDMKDVEDIIIQYSYNDEEENEDYVKNNDHLRISPRRVYDSACNALKWGNLYFPGKYFFTISKIFLKKELEDIKERLIEKKQIINQNNDRQYDKMAQSFIEVLKTSGWDFNKMHVFVFDICEYESLNDKFILELEKQLALPSNRFSLKNHVYPLHIVSVLKPSDFYLLDWHTRASGQKKLEVAIVQMLNSKK